MSDVFISYARSTAAQATAAAAGLRAAGYSVWLDEDLPAHRPYGREIETQLAAAKAALVIWSAEAVLSEWVLSEANRAREEHKLVQVLVDEARLPMPFDQIQCASLVGWDGGADHPGWRKALASVEALSRPATTIAPSAPEPPAAAPPQPAPQAAESGNLPRRLPSLFGRTPEIAQLTSLLERADLVTITGTGGVGKTRLAVELAERLIGEYPDGAWLVELAPVSDPEQVPSAIARAMAIELPVGQDALDALVERLCLRECLIVLDNCEHVVDAAAAFAEAILDRSRGIKLLASSQELLGVEGEQVFRLRSLEETDAAALFAERARAADAGFAVRERDQAAIAGICQRLDGIPLAIEMAAARAPSLGCEGVLQRLDDRFRLLTGGRRTALPRQRTLAATLEWSHGLLPERDATVFRRLGVFSGGFTLEAASDVAADDAIDGFEVVDAVTSLVAKSLVAADPGEERPRYRLLETTRAFALEKLDAAGETLATQRRHAEWALEFIRPASLEYETSHHRRRLRRALLRRERQPRTRDRLGARAERRCRAGRRAGGVRVGGLGAAVPVHGLSAAAGARDAAAGRGEDALGESALFGQPPRRSHDEPSSPGARSRRRDRRGRAPYARADMARGRPECEGVFSIYDRAEFEMGPLADELMRIIAALPTGRTVSQSKMLAASARLGSDGYGAADPLYREAISDLRAFGAQGLANWFEFAALTRKPMSPDEAVEFYRALLASVRVGEVFAGLTLDGIVGRLIFGLADRGSPRDLDEALDIYRRHYKRLATTQMRAYASCAIGFVMAGQGRLREAALLLGHADAYATRPAAS